MPSTYSPNLRLELQATGENRSTWGTKANGVFNLIEAAISGYVAIAMGDANVTLTTVNGATDQARNMIIALTGANTAIRTVTIPSVSKLYLVQNATTGGYGVNFKTAAGVAVVVPAGATRVIFSDGTDCYLAQSTLTVSEGGTGATTPADARTSLGLVIGTNVQAYDAALSSIAGLTTSADKMIYTTASDTYAVTGLTAFARTILDDADAATTRTTLGLVIGTDVQAYDNGLQSISALATAADKMLYTTALDTYTTTTITAFARSLIDDADAATARSTLGLVIGTDVQAYDADVAALGALAKTDGNFIVGNGTTWVAESGATARTSLGLGSMATEATTDYVPVTRTVTAGNGMTGGGALSANITLTMGTPSSITNDTTNSLTSTSHTHALGFVAAEVYTGSTRDNLSFPVGHNIAMYLPTSLDRNASAVPYLDTASTNQYVNLSHPSSGSALSGTYRNRGYMGGDRYLLQRTA